MHITTRNSNKNNMRGKFFIFGGLTLIELNDAKDILGYSKTTAATTLIKNISQINIVKSTTLNLTGTVKETIVLTEAGFMELANSIKERGKKQNAALAIIELNELKKVYNSMQTPAEPDRTVNPTTVDEMYDEIVTRVGQGKEWSEETKKRYCRLYDEIDKMTDGFNIRNEQRKYNLKEAKKKSVLSFVRDCTGLLPITYAKAQELFPLPPVETR